MKVTQSDASNVHVFKRHKATILTREAKKKYMFGEQKFKKKND
jgi:hypothetical protein